MRHESVEVADFTVMVRDRVVGVNEQLTLLTSEGNAESETLPAKPLIDVMLMVSVAAVPESVSTECSLGVIANGVFDVKDASCTVSGTTCPALSTTRHVVLPVTLLLA